MQDLTTLKDEFTENGFALIDQVYSTDEVSAMIHSIERADTASPAFRKSRDLFAIRQFLKELPQTAPLIFNQKLAAIISGMFGEGYFLVKSIYFDKPGSSNWFVAYHQDLTISVDKKVDMEGFGSWTAKGTQFAVQPPPEFLKSIFTIRIHLDDTDEHNGALRVIPESHAKGIYRPETIDWSEEKETICNVPKGGVMLMRPLLLHASGRSRDNRRRRVIHIELSNRLLPGPLSWSEQLIPAAAKLPRLLDAL